jgi:hypothetical protein
MSSQFRGADEQVPLFPKFNQHPIDIGYIYWSVLPQMTFQDLYVELQTMGYTLLTLTVHCFQQTHQKKATVASHLADGEATPEGLVLF